MIAVLGRNVRPETLHTVGRKVPQRLSEEEVFPPPGSRKPASEALCDQDRGLVARAAEPGDIFPLLEPLWTKVVGDLAHPLLDKIVKSFAVWFIFFKDRNGANPWCRIFGVFDPTMPSEICRLR